MRLFGNRIADFGEWLNQTFRQESALKKFYRENPDALDIIAG